MEPELGATPRHIRRDAPAENEIQREAVAEKIPARFSLLAEGLIGSPILKIAAEVRALAATGAKICNLTVGDFAPSEFPVPEILSRELAAAVQHGETNYPPSTGMPALRKAVAAFCERRLGMRAAPD